MERQAINGPFGFADAEIMSYQKVDDSLEVRIQAWNQKQVEIKFRGVVRVLDSDAGDISGLYEVLGGSQFLADAANRVYVSPMSTTSLHHYQFEDLGGEAALEIVAETISVAMASSRPDNFA